MEFLILGPLEARDGGHKLPLGGTKQRALLAMLLLHANEVVSSDRLIEELWDSASPRDAAKTLSVAISRLRKALEPSQALVTRPPGYELRLGTDRLDLHRFERLRTKALAAGSAAETAAGLREALALWRGPPLADLGYESFAQAQIARLEELRLVTLEDRLRADLELGRHAESVGELENLVAEHPLRERLHESLMLALYRSGRQAEALEVYRAARAALIDGLGIEPGRSLREVQESILRQDPALDLQPAAAAAGKGSRGAFVGRERELDELVRALDDALAGEGRMVLVAGEPGIGKSRLADELLAEARARGAATLIGRCWEAGGAPPYWPWVQSLRAYARETEPESLRSHLGDSAADLVQLLPELRQHLPEAPEPEALESEGGRFRLFEAVTSLLRQAAEVRPLVMVLDDFHAADEPSLLLLRFLAREMSHSRLLVLCTLRNADPTPRPALSAALADLVREPHCAQIELLGLSEPAVAAYLELSTGAEPARRQAQAIHSETEGNPLFVTEVVRLLDAEGRIESEALLQVPPGVRAVIGQRLARLSERCQRILVPACVIGREFGRDALARLTRLGGDELLDVLDEAIAERVLTEVAGVPGRLRFGHVLIRDTLYDGLTALRRMQLHEEVGAALEAVYSSDPGPHLAELAHHFCAAGPGGAGRAVDYARRAGDRAVTELAPEEAVRLYGMALEALAYDGEPGEATRCELLVALAGAHGRAGDEPSAKATFLAAAELARSAALPELLGNAALGYGGRFLWNRATSDERLVPLLEDALSALGTAEGALRVRLLTRLAAAIRSDASRERREAICAEAVDSARRLGDPATLAYALSGAEAALQAPQTAARRLREAEEIVSLAGPLGDRERLFDGHEHGYWAAWELGDPARRAAELRSMTLVANELKQPAQLWMLEAAKAALAIAQGRFADAEQLSVSAAAAGELVQSWSATAVRKLHQFVLRRELGSLDGFAREVRDFGHEFPSPLIHQSVLANVYVRLGRTAEAAAVVDELVRHDLSEWHLDEEWLAAICLLAETCTLLGDAERAGPLYDVLLPHRAFNAVAVVEVAFDSASRPLGMLAGLLGRFDDAAGHFDDALRMNTRMEAWPWVAHVEHEYAKMLAARGRPDDSRQAIEFARRALAAYERLGMKRSADEVASLAR